MKTIQFKCRLLSDVILNQKAATEGPNSTLDFIPGSCFLGIVANHYAKFEQEGTAMELFHSGKVRFGDAHPSQDGMRGLKIPASMFYPKLGLLYDELYIHHAIPDITDPVLRKKQLKQCREGFYTFMDNKAQKVETETDFAIKSAYDRKMRRSKDEQMYGYESLCKGLELLFEIEVDDEALVGSIEEALVGIKKIGRSRTAQYGLVDICPVGFKNVESTQLSGDFVTVYADGRLIFIDEFGQPTFRPNEMQLGLPEQSHIIWGKSQIRTFQYSPWNYKRQCFDADRCGIEKGSVFVVDVTGCAITSMPLSKYIGNYTNEGFGKVIYNPAFLSAQNDGSAFFHIEKKPDGLPIETTPLERTALLNYIALQQERERSYRNIYRKVNEWIDQNGHLFRGKEKFASQWGAIRNIAMSTDNADDIKVRIISFISHGIKSTDWTGARKNKLIAFADEFNTQEIRNAIINLASEMAKM